MALGLKRRAWLGGPAWLAAAAVQAAQPVQLPSLDQHAPPSLRADVPGGTRPGHGVHVGAHAEARAAAALQLEHFIRQTWGLP